MDSRKTNWLFLVIILTHFAVVGVLLWLGDRINFNMAVNCIVSEMIILLPGAMFLLGTKGRANDKLGFHKVKVTSLLMVVLFTFLCMPLVTVLNLFSMLFSSNAVASMEGDILEVGFPGMLALIGFYGPFCEEFVFRGLIFRGYKKSGSAFWAILLSSALFGLMHLNVNQAIYAFVIGILLALLVEVTGSLWTSVFCHVVFNSSQVCLMFLSSRLLAPSLENAVAEAEAAVTPEILIMGMCVYLVVATITTPLAFCVLAWIAGNEGRKETLREIWRRRKEKKEYLVSIPLLLAVVICVAYISIELIF